MELYDASEKIPSDRGSITGQCLNHYATPGPMTPVMIAPIVLAFFPSNLRQTHLVPHTKGLIYTLAPRKELLVNN
jgi:hypothetical protein